MGSGAGTGAEREFGGAALIPPGCGRLFVVAGAVAGGIIALGWAFGLPTDVVGPLAVLPLLAPLLKVSDWTVNRYGVWVAAFLAFMLMQVAHFGEHVAQMIQIHLLSQPVGDAHGIVGKLDIEWVHFIWNSIVVAAAVALLWHFRSNPWLWLTAAVAVWHLGEHVAIMTVFWDTGLAGDPGLLAQGGRLGGGFGLARPDLHFLYNVVETVPLVIAYVYAVRHEADRSPAHSPTGSGNDRHLERVPSAN